MEIKVKGLYRTPTGQLLRIESIGNTYFSYQLLNKDGSIMTAEQAGGHTTLREAKLDQAARLNGGVN